MGLRDKYTYAIQTAKDLHMQGSADERDGKLHFHGKVQTQQEANKIWDAIKTIPSWQQEIVADIQATGGAGATVSGSAATGSAGSASTHTVESGDTLSKIAKRYLGDANAYMDIYNLNRDQLTDPDKIKPGQILKLPQQAKT